MLIIAVVPILKALTNSYLSTVTIERDTRCLILAQAKLDGIKARSIYHYSSSYTENNTSLDGSYLCNVSDTGSGSDLRTITVSVGFDLNGDSTLATDGIEITISTRLANRWND